MERIDQEYDEQYYHYEPQRKRWHIPLYIEPAPTDSERLLSFRGYNNRNTSRTLSELNPDDCKYFCWKDCAIYGNAGGLTGRDHMDTLEEVYKEWFPHRARDKDLTDGSFFAKFMRFTPPVEKFEDILCFHRSLCERLQSLQVDVPDREHFAPFAVKREGVRRYGAFQLRPTFFSVFIVIDAGWKERGVLLVCNSEYTARELGIEGDREDVAIDEVVDGSDLGEARVFRCTLKCAMKAMLSQDPERARKRKEYNVLKDETFGSEDEE